MRIFVITTLTLLLFMGCTQEQDSTFPDNDVIIYGKEQANYSNEKDATRSISTLNEESQIAFYSKKGIQAHNVNLTLTGNTWHTTVPMKWETSPQNAQVTAYSTSAHSSPNGYYSADGNLKDILICKKEYPYQSPIELYFHHLFAKIEFQVESSLNKELKEIRLMPSIAIKEIEPYSANVTLMPSEPIHTVTFTQHKDGIYSITVPTATDFSLNIEIETSSGITFQKELTGLSVEGGYCYHSHIKEKDNHIGIYSAEDFIAFSYLVNRYPYEDRKLSEFGEIKDGIKTYYLKEDITFSDEQNSRFKQIGLFKNKFSNSVSFNDVFDGQNHTLTNLRIQKTDGDASALFPYIGKKGVVKNLKIDQATVTYLTPITTFACLCALNEGTIVNCHMTNTHLISSKGIMSGMTNNNRGYMYNCSLENTTLDLSALKNTHIEFGALTGINDTKGILLNSYVDNLKLTSKINPDIKISALAYGNNGIISNCYTDHCDPQIQILCWNNNNEINNCYYPKGRYDSHMIGKLKPKEFDQCHIIAFNESEESKQDLCNYLTNWISQTGKKKYPKCTFMPWKLNKDLTVTFDSL